MCDRLPRKRPDTVGEFAGLAEVAPMRENLLASWRQSGQKQDPCPSLLNHNAKYKRLLPPYCDFANGVGSKIGQFVLHWSERRRVAAICAVALNEREAQARHKAPKPSSSQRGCREFTHENDSYRDLFGERSYARLSGLAAAGALVVRTASAPSAALGEHVAVIRF